MIINMMPFAIGGAGNNGFQYAIRDDAPCSQGVMTVQLPFTPYIVVGRYGSSGVDNISSHCGMYMADPETGAVLFMKYKAAAGDFEAPTGSADYGWHPETNTLILKIGPAGNSATTASFYAAGR